LEERELGRAGQSVTVGARAWGEQTGRPEEEEKPGRAGITEETRSAGTHSSTLQRRRTGGGS
jgi:hypothetical protein